MTLDKDNISVEDAFDQLMADAGHSDTEPSNNSVPAGDQTDTDIDANATDTKIDTASADDSAKDNAVDDLGTTDVDWKSEATKWEHKFKSFEGRMQAELARRREEDDRRQQQYLEALTKATRPQTDGTVENANTLNKFKQLREDFPEIADAVEEYIKSEFRVANDVVQREISTKIDPIMQNISRVQTDSHLGRIMAKHPDAMEVRQSPQFEQWIDSLPSFAKAGALHVISLGSADEVVSLLDQYKSSMSKNQTNTTAKPAVKDNSNAANADLVAAVRSGLVVKSGRSSAPNTSQKVVDDNDLNAAWDEAVAYWEKAAK